jgi:hypothetical protein
MEFAMRSAGLALGVLVCGLLATSALAQTPPPYPPVPPGMPVSPGAPAPACLCLKQSVDASFAEMNARRGDLSAAQARLNDLDTQLAAARAREDVTNPQSVAEFRQLLGQRDAAFRQSSGDVMAASQAATARYNQAVVAYNNQCAGRPLPPPPPGPLACPGVP